VAVDFYFDPPTVQLPALDGLRYFYWEHISDDDLCHAIAQDYQYLQFHLSLLKKVKFTAAGQLHTKPWQKSLSLSVRAGAIKAALLICGSIAEAALRYIAEQRSYPLAKNPRHRTYGNVLKAWKGPAGGPRRDVRSHWGTLKELHDVRNNIHLFKSASDPSAHFEEVLKLESDLLPRALKAVEHLADVAP